MIADGLTKPLPAQKFGIFIQQLGLEDIGSRIREDQLKEQLHRKGLTKTGSGMKGDPIVIDEVSVTALRGPRPVAAAILPKQ